MKDRRIMAGKFLFPRIWVTIILTIVSAITLVIIFTKGWEMHPAASIGYVAAFYTLTVNCLTVWKIFPKYYKKIRTKLHENRYTDRYLTDVAFKTKVGLYQSLAINLLYTFVNAVSGIVYRTFWFGIFAVYYGIIAIMRFLLIRYVGRTPIGDNYQGELKRARLCSWILLTVNLVLSGAVLMMVYFDKGFRYQGLLIYVIAVYTFYITIAAVRDMIKYRRYKSPVMSVTKVIKMTSAMFSMLFLETAMFAQFGADTPAETKRIMIMATGGGISVMIVIMAFYLIVRTSGEIKRIDQKTGN